MKNSKKESMRKYRFKSIFSLLIAAVLIFSSSAFVGPIASADTLEELEAKYDEIEDKIKDNEEKIGKIEDDMEAQQSKVDVIESEINGLNSQIDILDDKISILNGDIGTLNGEISELDAQVEDINSQIVAAKVEIGKTEIEIDETYDLIIDRMSASYMMGDASTLEFLIGAKSLSELLTWTQYLQNASDYDNKLIEGLETDIENLEALNFSLNEKITALEATKAEINVQKEALVAKQEEVQSNADVLEGKKSDVEDTKRAAVALLKTLDEQSEEYARINKQLDAEQEKIDAQINAYLAEKGSSSTRVIDIKNDGTLTWPVPYSGCYISSPFGMRNGSMHRGIDICVSGGTAGKNFIAAQSGEVIKMGYNDPSMGNYVILDHGNGLFTAYYHASVLKVSRVGQKVEQGDVIGLMGETGNARGPHLHFEVRVNEGGTVVRKNPSNYVSMP